MPKKSSESESSDSFSFSPQLPQTVPTWLFLLMMGGSMAGGAGMGRVGMGEHVHSEYATKEGLEAHTHPHYATKVDLERLQSALDKAEEHLEETNKLLTEMRIDIAKMPSTPSDR